MSDDQRTFEARVLDHYPDVRATIAKSAGFADWLKTLSALEVDGETLYLRGHDMLHDCDQVMFEWARRHGLLTDAAIASALTSSREGGTQ